MIKEQFAALQEELKNKRFEASSSGNLVTVTLNGDGDLIDIRINPSCVDPTDVEGLQDLIMQAHKAAGDKVKEAAPSDLSGLPGGLFSF